MADAVTYSDQTKDYFDIVYDWQDTDKVFDSVGGYGNIDHFASFLKPESIPVSAVFIATQGYVDELTVELYAKALMEGAVFPPIYLVEIPDHGFYVFNGHHRLSAHRSTKRETISALVWRGKEVIQDANTGRN